VKKDTTCIDDYSADRKYDLILFGATGFTGKLAAVYLCQQYGGRDYNILYVCIY